MADETRKLMVILSFVALCLLGLESLRVHFSSYSALRGDFVYSSSVTMWIYLSVLILATFACFIRTGRSALNIAVVFLPFIFVVVFQLSQYPWLAHPDYFDMGTLVVVLTSNASIHDFLAYFQYPGSFILLTVICNTLNISSLESEILLVSLLTLLIPIVLLLIGKWLGIGNEWLVPAIFLAVGVDYVTRRQFTPQFPGLVLYILSVYMLMKISKERSHSWIFALILVVAATTAIHPFSSVFILLTVFVSFLFQRANIVHSGSSRALLLLGLVVFLTWNAYVASPYFQQGVESATSFLTLERFASSVEPRDSPGGLLGIVVSLYRYGVHAFFFCAASLGLIKYRHQQKVRQLLIIAISVLMGSLALVLVAPGLAVQRGIVFSYVPVSVAASLLLIKSFPNVLSRPSAAGRRVTWTHVAVAIVLILDVTTFVAASSFASSSGAFVYPSEMQVARFAIQHLHDQPSTWAEELMVYSYYRGEYVTENRYSNAAWYASDAQEKLLSRQFSLQNPLKQEFLFGLGFVGTNRSLVYNDGLNRIYMGLGP